MVPESAGHDSGHGTPKFEVHVQEYSPPIGLIARSLHTLLSLMLGRGRRAVRLEIIRLRSQGQAAQQI